jgi:hypothetical protein
MKKMKSAGVKASGISRPSTNDVISGRGPKIQNHPGNVNYRKVIESRRMHYVQATKNYVKDQLARQVYSIIIKMNPPGRFLKKDRDGMYYIQDEQVIIVKIKQALRENSVETKDKIDIASVAKKNDRYTPFPPENMTRKTANVKKMMKPGSHPFLPDGTLLSQSNGDQKKAAAAQNSVGEKVKKRSQKAKLSNAVKSTQISQIKRDQIDPDMDHVVELLLNPSSDSEDTPKKKTKLQKK